MIREFGVQLYETVRFHRCQLDNSGILILDLRDTRPRRPTPAGIKIDTTLKFVRPDIVGNALYLNLGETISVGGRKRKKK